MVIFHSARLFHVKLRTERHNFAFFPENVSRGTNPRD